VGALTLGHSLGGPRARVSSKLSSTSRVASCLPRSRRRTTAVGPS